MEVRLEGKDCLRDEKFSGHDGIKLRVKLSLTENIFFVPVCHQLDKCISLTVPLPAYSVGEDHRKFKVYKRLDVKMFIIIRKVELLTAV